ncbi:MAG: prolipoprotein diacylglyceryl transferase [Armatimonadetes bacterium]|nr:prolipoprotein diacylglyceryl transferase [Armatimonadota bacterium]
MLPELFRIGGYPIRSFGVMLVIGFLAGYWLASKRAEKYGISKDQLSNLAIFALIAGVLGARIGWVAQEWAFYAKNPGEILKVTEGGMTSYGGVLFGVLAVWIWAARTKVSMVAALDLLAAPALIMHGFGRIGCFLNGCCYGGPCELPWAVEVHPDEGSNYLGHPAQLYDTMMAFAGAAFLFWYEKRTFYAHKAGQYSALFFLLYGISRFVYEFFRAGYSSTSSFGLALPDGQLAAVAMILLGGGWLLLLSRRAR